MTKCLTLRAIRFKTLAFTITCGLYEIVMKTLALIPARGGSKRLPRKNIKLCAGKPLIAWTIEAALAAKLIDEVWVSTEDREIADVARHFNANVVARPAELATDSATSESVLRHALTILNDPERFTHVCLLQPTSPCRTSAQIDDILTLLNRYRPAIGTRGPSPEPNGGIYAWELPFSDHMPMRAETMDTGPDIDTLDDFLKAEEILLSRETALNA